MNNFKELNLLLKHQKNELNGLYKTPECNLVSDLLKITGLKDSSNARMAVLKRIIELKEEGLENEMQKAGFSPKKQRKIKANVYEFISEFYKKRFTSLLKNAKTLKALDDFNYEILALTHEIGVILNEMQKAWQKRLIDENTEFFKKHFKNIASANEFIKKHKLYQPNADKSMCDRIYGAPNLKNLKMQTYATAFKKESKMLKNAFNTGLKRLKKAAKSRSDEQYINYFKALKNAFLEQNNDKVVSMWQDAERVWMKCKGDIQIGHPLEYYEDAYTHAVALEWDIRLKDSSHKIDENALKEQIKSSFLSIYKSILPQNDGCKKDKNYEKMRSLVLSNIDKTQLYISNPLMYYGADLNGLFSAQVVPNDEIVSKKCGKKIFAFVDFIHNSSKARPFSKLASEIFEREFLDFNREILFCKPETWKKIYEITTIGHEFGHILFIDDDTENSMNIGGEFKFVEEFKATSGGLINFFLNENADLAKSVFASHISRSVGLIGWQKVNEVRAYYCEGLIHLALLFKSGALSFENNALKVNLDCYDKYKIIALQNYHELAAHYSKKADSSEFLARFASLEGGVYLPVDKKVREFVEFYYAKHEIMANEIDTSGEWEKWQARAK